MSLQKPRSCGMSSIKTVGNNQTISKSPTNSDYTEENTKQKNNAPWKGGYVAKSRVASSNLVCMANNCYKTRPLLAVRMREASSGDFYIIMLCETCFSNVISGSAVLNPKDKTIIVKSP